MTCITRRSAGLLAVLLVPFAVSVGSAQTQTALRDDADDSTSLLERRAGLVVRDVTLGHALTRLTEKSGVIVVFSPSLLRADSRKVTCDCEQRTVGDALDLLLAGTRFRYSVMDGQIALIPKLILNPVVPDRMGPVKVAFLGERQRTAAAQVDTGDAERGAVRPSVRQDTVAGTVISAETGQPIRGALVSVPGSDLATITDAQGRFRIAGLDGTTVTLQVVLIGYAVATRDVSVGAVDVQIELEQSAIPLEGLVVGALGIDRAGRALGYSVSRASAEDMTINRSPNFVNALQGKMAGVTITPMGSGPQGSSKVRIRGQSSIGANNSPLIVVNGVPIDNTTFGVSGDVGERGSNRNSDSGDGLASINPDDIVDMTVLKGAAASALYGARAKDGVIMITTRNRASGTGIQVEYNTNFTTETPLDFRDYQMEYGQGEGGARPTSPFPTSGVWSFGERFQPGMTQILFDGVEVPYEPQPNQLQEYYRTGYNTSNTLTVSQGGENGGVSVSLSNLTSQAILPSSDYRRNSASVGFTQRVAQRFNISGNVHYSNERRKNPANIAEQDYSPVVIYTLATSMPVSLLKEKAFTGDGDEMLWSRFTNRTNPYFALSRFENNNRDRIFGNVTGRFDVTDWLFVQGRVGQDLFSRDQEYNLPTGSQRQPPPPPGFVNGQYVQDQLNLREINADFLVGADRRFDRFAADVNFGGNLMRRRSERSSVLVQDFYSRHSYTLANGRLLSPQYSLSERQVNSIYGAAELSYLDMVFVSGTLRNDWFSTLAPEHRSILYPSVSASLVFTDVVPVPQWLSFGKLRVAYAEVGSDTDVPPYSDNLFYAINPNLLRNRPIGNISGSVLPNPDLRPMRLSEWEFGLEMNLFENLTLEVGYYDRISSDQILSQQISNASGFTTRRVNAGKSQNRGVELFAEATPVSRERFAWRTNLNTAYNVSKVLDLGTEVGVDRITVGQADFHGELRQVVGKPLNQLYGWGWARDGQGRQVFNPVNGIPMRSDEQLAFGSALPKWVGGINNSVDYRGVSMSFLVDFKLGHKMISGTHINAYRHGLDKATLAGREDGFVIGDGVNPDGSENTTPAGIQPFYEAIRTHQTSEQSVFNAGSWQLRQITIGYEFAEYVPLAFTRFSLDALGVTRLRLNAVVNNVAVLKKWVPHIHPDQDGIISDARMGLEATGLPVTRGVGLNVNVRF